MYIISGFLFYIFILYTNTTGKTDG